MEFKTKVNYQFSDEISHEQRLNILVKTEKMFRDIDLNGVEAHYIELCVGDPYIQFTADVSGVELVFNYCEKTLYLHYESFESIKRLYLENGLCYCETSLYHVMDYLYNAGAEVKMTLGQAIGFITMIRRIIATDASKFNQ